MSRVIYSTQALVLAADPQGEAHKLFTLLTRDMGTVRALATSIRLERSKLRYALEPLSLVNVSLVSAKRGWRVTTAEPVRSFFFDIDEPNKRALVLRISALLRRLAIGESLDPTLFDMIIEGFAVLREIPDKYVKGLEIVFVLRILENLGYGIEEADSDLYEESLHNTELYEKVLQNKRKLVRSINQALEMSGL